MFSVMWDFHSTVLRLSGCKLPSLLLLSLLLPELQMPEDTFLHIFLRMLPHRIHDGVLPVRNVLQNVLHRLLPSLFPISLQSFYKGNSKFFCKIRVFPISFMSSAPSWITKNIDIRRPESQALYKYLCLLLYGNALYFARASVATYRSLPHFLSKVAAIPIACGNTVALPALATP